MNLGDGVPEPVDLESSGEDVVVLRPAAEVEVRSMPYGGADFVAALANGQSLVEATKTAIRVHVAFDISSNLAALFGAGAFVGCRLDAAVDQPDMARGPCAHSGSIWPAQSTAFVQ